jgi:hypothetical protein
VLDDPGTPFGSTLDSSTVVKSSLEGRPFSGGSRNQPDIIRQAKIRRAVNATVITTYNQIQGDTMLEELSWLKSKKPVLKNVLQLCQHSYNMVHLGKLTAANVPGKQQRLIKVIVFILALSV